jgi:general stress protein YciG
MWNVTIPQQHKFMSIYSNLFLLTFPLFSGGEFLSTRIEERKGKITVAEAGRKGGEKTASNHGREFYEEIGRKGGEKVSQERGPEFYSEIGRKGGASKGNSKRTNRTKRGSGRAEVATASAK